jgi:hypothetical protein
LRYEHEFYVQSRRRFPKEGRILRTARGEEKVTANDIFRERVSLRGPDGETRIVPLADLRREVEDVARELGIPAPTIGHPAQSDAHHRHEPAEATLDHGDKTAQVEPEPPVEVTSAGDSTDPNTAGESALDDESAVACDGDDAEVDEAVATPPRPGGEGKPRRRRGRRGGRRNRQGGGRGPRGPSEPSPDGDGQ